MWGEGLDPPPPSRPSSHPTEGGRGDPRGWHHREYVEMAPIHSSPSAGLRTPSRWPRAGPTRTSPGPPRPWPRPVQLVWSAIFLGLASGLLGKVIARIPF